MIDNGFGIAPDKGNGAYIGTKITKERIALPQSSAHVNIGSRTDDVLHGITVTIITPLKIKKTQND